MACSQFGNIGFLPEKMSVYRIHTGGAWSGKNIFEQLEFTCRHMDVSNQFFDYRYNALFRQRRKVFEEEITRQRALVDAQKTDARASGRSIEKLLSRIKRSVKTGWRLYKHKLFRNET
jgi:hypothetical protein